MKHIAYFSSAYCFSFSRCSNTVGSDYCPGILQHREKPTITSGCPITALPSPCSGICCRFDGNFSLARWDTAIVSAAASHKSQGPIDSLPDVGRLGRGDILAALVLVLLIITCFEMGLWRLADGNLNGWDDPSLWHVLEELENGAHDISSGDPETAKSETWPSIVI